MSGCSLSASARGLFYMEWKKERAGLGTSRSSHLTNKQGNNNSHLDLSKKKGCDQLIYVFYMSLVFSKQFTFNVTFKSNQTKSQCKEYSKITRVRGMLQNINIAKKNDIGQCWVRMCCFEMRVNWLTNAELNMDPDVRDNTYPLGN